MFSTSKIVYIENFCKKRKFKKSLLGSAQISAQKWFANLAQIYENDVSSPLGWRTNFEQKLSRNLSNFQ